MTFKEVFRFLGHILFIRPFFDCPHYSSGSIVQDISEDPIAFLAFLTWALVSVMLLKITIRENRYANTAYVIFLTPAVITCLYDIFVAKEKGRSLSYFYPVSILGFISVIAYMIAKARNMRTLKVSGITFLVAVTYSLLTRVGAGAAIVMGVATVITQAIFLRIDRDIFRKLALAFLILSIAFIVFLLTILPPSEVF